MTRGLWLRLLRCRFLVGFRVPEFSIRRVALWFEVLGFRRALEFVALGLLGSLAEGFGVSQGLGLHVKGMRGVRGQGLRV